jgi:DNA-binding transcriptional LysR family regulator
MAKSRDRRDPPPDAAAATIGDDDRRRRLPPLSMLRAFEAVGRHGSMRKAADDLGVCHTVVSRHVQNLQDWFGTRLVETGPRGVALTEQGALVYAATAAAFDRIAEATAELRPDRVGARQLRLWCVPGLASRWLPPRLSDLQAALPGVEIVVRATTEKPDLKRGDADAVICFGETPPEGGRALQLERTRIFPVASPEWIERQPPIETLGDLAKCFLIHEDSRDQWRRFFRAAGHEPPSTLHGPRLWYASSAHEAALAGQGVALATRLQAADDLVAGRLVELLATEVCLGGYWFVAAEQRWDTAVILRLRQWFAASVATTDGGLLVAD